MMTNRKEGHHLFGGSENVVPLSPIPVRNSEFLEFIFGSGARVWTTNFRTSPSNAMSRHWGGKFSVLPETKATDEAQSNTYFCTATFIDSETEGMRRKTEYFRALHVVVIDDIGTKGDPLAVVSEKLRPSYVIETSKNNYQVAFVLKKPITDIRTATYLANFLNGEVGDPSAKGANRVVRLPFGVNTKNESVWKCRFQEFTGIRYSIDEIATAFDIDFNGTGRLLRAGIS
jgi:hypothetical protein